MNHVGKLPVDNKKTPIGFKWCPRCAETKKLDEFPSIRVKRAGKPVQVPYSICSSCNVQAGRRSRARQKAAE